MISKAPNGFMVSHNNLAMRRQWRWWCGRSVHRIRAKAFVPPNGGMGSPFTRSRRPSQAPNQ